MIHKGPLFCKSLFSLDLPFSWHSSWVPDVRERSGGLLRTGTRSTEFLPQVHHYHCTRNLLSHQPSVSYTCSRVLWDRWFTNSNVGILVIGIDTILYWWNETYSVRTEGINLTHEEILVLVLKKKIDLYSDRRSLSICSFDIPTIWHFDWLLQVKYLLVSLF